MQENALRVSDLILAGTKTFVLLYTRGSQAFYPQKKSQITAYITSASFAHGTWQLLFEIFETTGVGGSLSRDFFKYPDTPAAHL